MMMLDQGGGMSVPKRRKSPGLWREGGNVIMASAEIGENRRATPVRKRKKWDARYSHKIPHTNDYYFKCTIGGVLSCGLTHALVTPLDVTKVNMQVNATKYRGLLGAMRTIIREEGPLAIWKGLLPTWIGYSIQGFLKFGLYEVFKDSYSSLVGEENAKKYRGLIWLAGSASAEFFADIGLCPMEMVKVKIQTSRPGTWPQSFGPALRMMRTRSAETRFPLGSVRALWSRQIPYTMAKFFFFEKVVSLFYNHIFVRPKDSYSKATKLGITFGSGYIAGVMSAVVSHPADSLVSLLAKTENRGKPMRQIALEVGCRGLFTKGLGTRIFMTGTLTGLQWWIYDSLKTAFDLGSTGGK